MSGGRLDIHVYGGGELVPALEAFDAVRSGAAEIGSGAAYYWAGKAPATQFFASVPFGMNAQQLNAWILSGGGMQLWEELYADFGLVPMLGGNTGVQMGGWFNKEINTIADLKGLKMRMPGLGSKVLERAGGAPGYYWLAARYIPAWNEASLMLLNGSAHTTTIKWASIRLRNIIMRRAGMKQALH